MASKMGFGKNYVTSSLCVRKNAYDPFGPVQANNIGADNSISVALNCQIVQSKSIAIGCFTADSWLARAYCRRPVPPSVCLSVCLLRSYIAAKRCDILWLGLNYETLRHMGSLSDFQNPHTNLTLDDLDLDKVTKL